MLTEQKQDERTVKCRSWREIARCDECGLISGACFEHDACELCGGPLSYLGPEAQGKTVLAVYPQIRMSDGYPTWVTVRA